ncbi:MAG: ArsR family transcriptional regulator [Candidatus Moranbacteria bacterium]|nr:ArsR family transcriptional regulator [Candidatus Moranbacteria bacterium]
MKCRKCALSPEEYILVAAMKLEVTANRHVFHSMRLSFMSVKIMGYLSHAKAATPTDIMNSVGGTKSNVSQRLNYLEKEGYISRKFDKFSGDKRKVVIKITKQGEEVLNEVTKRLDKMRRSLRAHFSKEEIEANARFCSKMISILNLSESKKYFDK